MQGIKILFIVSLFSLSFSYYEVPVVDVMVESLCPDCMDFIEKSFSNFFSYAKHEELAIVNFIPFGNAHEKWNGQKWEFTCQHRENECYGNIIETCGIHYFGRQESYPYLICMEKNIISFNKNFDNTLKHCVTDPAMVEKILECTHGDLGNQLEHEMAQKTPSDHQYVPWILVNGQHDTRVEDQILSNMLNYFCSLKPGGCDLYFLSQTNKLNKHIICRNELKFLE